MIDRRLHFLNARNVVAADDQREISQAAAQDFAAVIAEQRNGEQPTFARLFERHHDVARSAAGGNSNSHILGPRVCNQLAQEYHFGADIVGDGADIGRFHRE